MSFNPPENDGLDVGFSFQRGTLETLLTRVSGGLPAFSGVSCNSKHNTCGQVLTQQNNTPKAGLDVGFSFQ